MCLTVRAGPPGSGGLGTPGTCGRRGRLSAGRPKGSPLSCSHQGCVLRGWVDLTSDDPHTVKKSIKYLEQGIQDTQDVLGLMGKVGKGVLTGPLGPETIRGPQARPSPQAPGLAGEEQGREGSGSHRSLAPRSPLCSSGSFPGPCPLALVTSWSLSSMSLTFSSHLLIHLVRGGGYVLYSLYMFCIHST